MKDTNGNFIPCKIDVIPKNLSEKIMVVIVGDDKNSPTEEFVEYVRKTFISSPLMKDIIKNSTNAHLLILPNSIKIELLSKNEFDNKEICLQLNNKDDVSHLPEIKIQLKNMINKVPHILPIPILLKEYEEIKKIKERSNIRRKRRGVK